MKTDRCRGGLAAITHAGVDQQKTPAWNADVLPDGDTAALQRLNLAAAFNETAGKSTRSPKTNAGQSAADAISPVLRPTGQEPTQ